MRGSKVAGSKSLPAVLFSLLILSLAASMPAHAANQRPTISGSPASWVYVDSLYSFTPSASDPEGARLTFSVVNLPSWAAFDPATGRLIGTPRSVGLWTKIRIRVSDGRWTVSLPELSIRATSRSNSAPTISGTPATSVLAGSSYRFKPSASDANGDPLRFSISNRPAWAKFSTVSGVLSGTPAEAHAGSYPGIVITVTDGATTTALPAFTITVTSAVNRAPTISGTPSGALNAGEAYSFTPSASDADGDALGFSIQNRPAWATFNTASGQLAGTPGAASVGTYSNIVISVSDGRASASLPAFAITVSDVSIGSASLSWTAPTQNTDGSALTNLAGFRISYGPSATQLHQTVQLSNPGIDRYVIENLSPGTYYFAVRAYSSAGAESDSSNLASKTVR